MGLFVAGLTRTMTCLPRKMGRFRPALILFLPRLPMGVVGKGDREYMTTFGCCETAWLPLLLETSPDKAAPMAATAQRPELGGAQLKGGAETCVDNCLPGLTSISGCPAGGATNTPERRANDAPKTAAPRATRAEPLEAAFLAIMPGTPSFYLRSDTLWAQSTTCARS